MTKIELLQSVCIVYQIVLLWNLIYFHSHILSFALNILNSSRFWGKVFYCQTSLHLLQYKLCASSPQKIHLKNVDLARNMLAFVRDQTRVPKGDPTVGLSDHLTCSHGVLNPGPWKLNFILVQCVLAKWSSLSTLKYFTFNIYGKIPKHKPYLWRELLWHFNHDIYVLYSKIWHDFFLNKTKLSCCRSCYLGNTIMC